MKIILFISALSLSVFSLAQKEANIWYFGEYAGVSFESGKAVAINNSVLSTDEGCSVICDREGNLLFYTDGISVWNKMHKIMPNGAGLKGNPSSTQSGVVIPYPNQAKKYILFTVTQTAGEDGVRYSIVDMTLNEGLGDVVSSQKDIALFTPVTEKLTAVKHRNGKDTWVVVHAWKSNEFLSFLVTEKGVTTTPVSSKVGTVHDGGTLNTQGYLKANPDGTNLALALEESDIFELFDFDNASGKVSEPLTLKIKDKSYPYGVEFSPDGSLFYGTAAGTGEIYQFNLQAGSPEQIKASGKVIGKTEGGIWVGALQIANDGKIYFPIYKKNFLGVIHSPNSLGNACGFESNYVNLGDEKKYLSRLGLPTFTQSFFVQEVKAKEVKYFDEKKVNLNERLIMNNLLFDFGKYSLQSSSFVELKKVIAVLKANPSYKVEISGHTDNIGNKSSNITLSQNRAGAVRDYLVSQGINTNRISLQGFGSSQAIANNETEAGRAKNRRVEIVFKGN